MKFCDKSQVLVLSIIVLLLVIIPLFPSSLRPSYLYFIFNILIIALGAEAGLLSAFSEPLDEKKQPFSVTQKPVNVVIMPQEAEDIPEKKEAFEKCCSIASGSSVSEHNEKKKPKVAEKSESDEKIVVGVTIEVLDKVKKCLSIPSLFFIGGGEEAELEFMEEEEEEEVEAEDEIGGVSGQELFAKAEDFIGNFYKQLKVQRDEPWTYQKSY